MFVNGLRGVQHCSIRGCRAEGEKIGRRDARRPTPRADSRFEAECDGVRHADDRTEPQPDGTLVQQRAADKRHRAPHVHRVAQDVEGETVHFGLHEDPKVVAEVRAGDAERVDRGPHERLAESDQRKGEELNERVREDGEVGLRAEGRLEERVACETEEEDGQGESVASVQRRAEQMREGAVLVFWPVSVGSGEGSCESCNCNHPGIEPIQPRRRLCDTAGNQTDAPFRATRFQ